MSNLSKNFYKKKKKKYFVGKDLDFVQNEKIILGNELKNNLMDTIKKDVKFLKTHNLMDYSMLIVISEGRIYDEQHKKYNNKRFNRAFWKQVYIRKSKLKLSFAIIDYL